MIMRDPIPAAVEEELDREGPSAQPLAVSLRNYPNPFNAQTTIAYVVPQAGDVLLSVYNTAGQKIRTLVEGYRSAGTYSVVWDGRDAEGHPMASGTYFYELRAGGSVEMRQMTLVK